MSKYSYCSSLAVNCPVWNDFKRTSLYTNGILLDGLTYYKTNSSGVIYETGTCPVPITQYATTYYRSYGGVVPDPGYIYKSTDYGTNWSILIQATGDYVDMAVSSNGVYITIIIYNSYIILRSSDGGAYYSFIGISGLNNPTSVAMSTNGEYQLITDGDGWVYRSTNYGLNWTQLGHSPGNKQWSGAAMSSSGQFQTVVAGGFAPPKIVTSNNYGVSWSNKQESYWNEVAMSSDGKYQLVAGSYSYLTLSTNYGSTFNSVVWPWTPAHGTGQKNWLSVAVSSTGQYMLAVEDYGLIWLSQNYGATWTNQTGNGLSWKKVSMFPSGQFMFAVTNTGPIWRSTNYGATWSTIPNTNARAYSSLNNGGGQTTSPSHPAAGTFLYDECVQCDLYAFRADGNGGVYQAEVLQYNTEACCTIGPGGGGGGGGGEDFV